MEYSVYNYFIVGLFVMNPIGKAVQGCYLYVPISNLIQFGSTFYKVHRIKKLNKKIICY